MAAGGDYRRDFATAQRYGVGVEVQTFAFPAQLNKDFAAALDDVARLAGSACGPIGCHGAFMDTVHFSMDREVRAVARKRYLESLDVAEAIGARYVVFHSQFNPVIRVPVYLQSYLDGSMQFWPEVLREAERRKLVVYMENMFDEAPEPMLRVIEKIASPTLRLCLDIAHAAVFSRLPLTDWIDAFGAHLGHVHLNDCRGEQDDHLGLGQGALDIPRALSLLRATELPLTYALETGPHSAASLEYLGLEETRTHTD